MLAGAFVGGCKISILFGQAKDVSFRLISLLYLPMRPDPFEFSFVRAHRDPFEFTSLGAA